MWLKSNAYTLYAGTNDKTLWDTYQREIVSKVNVNLGSQKLRRFIESTQFGRPASQPFSRKELNYVANEMVAIAKMSGPKNQTLVGTPISYALPYAQAGKANAFSVPTSRVDPSTDNQVQPKGSRTTGASPRSGRVARHQSKEDWARRIYREAQQHGNSFVRAAIASPSDARRILDYEIAGNPTMDVSTVNSLGYSGPLQFGGPAWYDGTEFLRLPGVQKVRKSRDASNAAVQRMAKNLERGGVSDIDYAPRVAVEFWNRNWISAKRMGAGRMPKTVEFLYLMHNQGGGGGASQFLNYLRTRDPSQFFAIGKQSKEAVKLKRAFAEQLRQV